MGWGRRTDYAVGFFEELVSSLRGAAAGVGVVLLEERVEKGC